MSFSQEAETGGIALHDKWQSGHTCTAAVLKTDAWWMIMVTTAEQEMNEIL